MLIIIIALLTLICSASILSGSLIGMLFACNHKISLAYSFLFVVYIVQSCDIIEYTIFDKLQAYLAAFEFSGLFNASNHFVLSLDIISLFSAFILILFHRLRMTQSFL